MPVERAALAAPHPLTLAGFSDIQVLPAAVPQLTRSKRPDGLMTGGPVWPLDAPDWVRFTSRGTPIDRPGQPAARCDAAIEEPCLWGGYLQNHFGHLIAEHCGRLLASRKLRPDDPVLFVHDPGVTLESLPSFVRDVVGWAGVAPEAMRLIDRPTLARQLRVVPQSEPYCGEGPSAAHLAPRRGCLVHVEVTRRLVAPVSAWGLRTRSLAISSQDVNALIGGLAALGLDLALVWDQRSNLAAAHDDLDAWVAALARMPGIYNVTASTEALAAALRRGALKT